MSIPAKNPTSTISVSVAKDESAALAQTRGSNRAGQDAQTFAEIGLPVPVVFCKEVSGTGGAWIYPPAVRYGFQYVYRYGTTSSIAYVLSDGQIGSVSASDIYKGQLVLTDVQNSAATVSHGSVPTAGFDYTQTALVYNSLDFYVGESISTTYTATFSDVYYLAIINLRVFTPPNLSQLFQYVLTADGVIVASSGSSMVSSLSYSAQFQSRKNVVLTITSAYSGSPGTPYPANTGIYARFTVENLTTGTPENSDVFQNQPKTPGSGGTFNGLTCLAVKGYFPETLAYGDSVVENYSEPITTQVTITRTGIMSLVLDNLRVSVAGVGQQYLYNIYVDGVIADGTSISATVAALSLDYRRTYFKPVDVVVVIEHPSGSFPAGALVEATIETQTSSNDTELAKSAVASDAIKCLIRNGIEVPNLLTGTTASSNNFLDLAQYLLIAAKVPSGLIDTTAFTEAATFTAYHSMYFNGALTSASNLKTYFEDTAPFFLLRSLTVDGKYSFKPVLPINNDGSFDTGVISATHTFSAADIIRDSYTRTYTQFADRKDICVLIAWRDQSGADAEEKMLEIRYTGEAVDGPFEVFDMYDFCVTQDHAALVGKYILATRKRVTHTISFATTVDVGNLSPLDIIKVEWNYADALDTTGGEAYFYQIDSIAEFVTGEIQIEATHFPLNNQGKSRVIADILNASYTEN